MNTMHEDAILVGHAANQSADVRRPCDQLTTLMLTQAG